MKNKIIMAIDLSFSLTPSLIRLSEKSVPFNTRFNFLHQIFSIERV